MDDEDCHVSVDGHESSMHAVFRNDETNVRRRLSICTDKFGRWKCGEGILQPDKSNESKILWRSDTNKARHWT